MEQTLIYIEFYVAGDCIFSCQKSWFPCEADIEIKSIEIADLHKVEPMLVTWAERVVKLPISLPENFMEGLLSGTGVALSDEDLDL